MECGPSKCSLGVPGCEPSVYLSSSVMKINKDVDRQEFWWVFSRKVGVSIPAGHFTPESNEDLFFEWSESGGLTVYGHNKVISTC